MNVNPLVLVAAGTVVVGIASIAICAKPAKKDSSSSSSKKKTSTSAAVSAPTPVVEHASAPAAEAAAPAVKKGKKKVRSNKKKKTSTESGPDDESSGEEPAKVPEVAKKPEAAAAAAAAAAKKPEPVKPSPVKAAPEPVEPESDEEFSMYTNKSGAPAAPKKPKKAKETPEQKAARVERQKAREAEKAAEELLFASEQSFVDASAAAGQPDGWSVIEVRKPKKKEEEGAPSPVPEPTPAPVAPEPVVPAGPVVETITTPVTVDSKKIGLLIGPKGATKMGIQNLTGATIEMPKIEKDAAPTQVVVNVTGTAPAVAKAVHALNELCLKGYATLLAGDDFQEGYVAIHPRFLPDVIGKAGVVIRALQTHTGVKITTPANTAKADGTPATKIKIGLAGPREKVTEARNLIKEITKYYHTAVTHPGVVHTEMDIPDNYYNYIIGSKGSEIKHIQNSFKVSVYIPNAESNNSNVLLVGEPAAVAAAEKHIHKLIEKVDAMAAQRAEQEAANAAFKAANAAAREAARAAAQAASGAPQGASFVGAGGRPSTAKVDKDDEPQEEWMKEFAPRGPGINMGDILPASKFGAAPDASA